MLCELLEQRVIKKGKSDGVILFWHEISLGYKKQFVSKYADLLILVLGAFDLEQSPKISC